jgi:hypothetical protein
MPPAAKHVHYVYTIKLAQKFTTLRIGLKFFFPRTALVQAKTNGCEPRLDTHALSG